MIIVFLFVVLFTLCHPESLTGSESSSGILYGPFILHPRLDLGEGYESNVFRSPVSVYPDLYTRLRPLLGLEVRSLRFFLFAEGQGERYLYSALEDPITRRQNRTSLSGEIKTSLELLSGLHLEGRGYYKDTSDPLYGDYTLDRNLLRRFRTEIETAVNQLLFYEELKSELRYQFFRDTFPDPLSATSRTIHTIRFLQTFRPIPEGEYFAEMGYQRIGKLEAKTIAPDFSPGGGLVFLHLGFSGSFSPFYRLVTRLGAGALQYKGEPVVWTPDLSLEFFYLPNAFTELGILGKYTFQDSVYVNYFRVLQGGVHWKQHLGRVFTLTNGFLLWRTIYSSPFPREDRIFLFRSGLQWEPLALREIRAMIGYEGSRRDSQDDRADFVNHTAFLDLSLVF